MLGIVVQLALSLLFLRWFDRSNSDPMGLMPNRQRLLDFLIFFLISAAFSASGYGMRMWVAGHRWIMNPAVSMLGWLDGARWTLVSVVFEELIFRGALLYALIRKLGSVRGVWISGAAFGVYHWFSQGSFGQPGAMAVTFVITGVMGLVQAFAFARTGSLYVPTAIHIGWNLVQQNVFSHGPIGPQLLVEVLPRPDTAVSQVTWLVIQLLPLVGGLLMNFLVVKARTSAEAVPEVPKVP